MLKARVLTAIVLIVLVLAGLFLFPQAAWIALASAVLALSAWEWGGLAGLTRWGRPAFAALLPLLMLVLLALSSVAPDGVRLVYWLALVFWVLVVPVSLWKQPGLRAAAAGLLAGVFVLVPSFLALVTLRAVSPSLLLAIMLLVWISDSAAYFAGRRWGRRKLAASISPGKTWEGVFGAMAAVAIYALLWAEWGKSLIPAGSIADTPAALIGLSLVLTAAGVVGDLFKSLLKRQADVKDSGDLLPGHGGILDRIDALMAVLPFAALIFKA
ncbi:MAG: phosphatidate cytidylyltransferase [Burkholderiales bacterium]